MCHVVVVAVVAAVALVCMLIALLLFIVYSYIYKRLIGLSVHSTTFAVALHAIRESATSVRQCATVCCIGIYVNRCSCRYL